MIVFKSKKTLFGFNIAINVFIVQAIKNHPPAGIIYDIGGGNGFTAAKLKQKKFSVILVEPDINGARNAKKRGLDRIICGCLGDLSFSDNHIPAITLFDVLEHISDDNIFLKKIHSLIKKNGIFYLTVPTYQSLWSIDDNFAGHFRRYRLHELEKKLVNVGFSIKYSTYFFTFLPLAILLFRSIPSWLGKRKLSLSKVKQEHQKITIQNKILSTLLRPERLMIQHNKKIPFGSSCLIVAQK